MNTTSVPLFANGVLVHQSNHIYNYIHGCRKHAWQPRLFYSMCPSFHQIARQEEIIDLPHTRRVQMSNSLGNTASHHVGFFNRAGISLSSQHRGHSHHSSPVCAADGGWRIKSGRACTVWLKPTAPQHPKARYLWVLSRLVMDQWGTKKRDSWPRQELKNLFFLVQKEVKVDTPPHRKCHNFF